MSFSCLCSKFFPAFSHLHLTVCCFRITAAFISNIRKFLISIFIKFTSMFDRMEYFSVNRYILLNYAAQSTRSFLAHLLPHISYIIEPTFLQLIYLDFRLLNVLKYIHYQLRGKKIKKKKENRYLLVSHVCITNNHSLRGRFFSTFPHLQSLIGTEFI